VSRKICFVAMGFGKKMDYRNSKEVDLDIIYKKVIKNLFDSLTLKSCDAAAKRGIIIEIIPPAELGDWLKFIVIKSYALSTSTLISPAFFLFSSKEFFMAVQSAFLYFSISFLLFLLT